MWAFTPGSGGLKGVKVMGTDDVMSPEVGAYTPGIWRVTMEKGMATDDAVKVVTTEIPEGWGWAHAELSSTCRMSACRFCCPNGDILC